MKAALWYNKEDVRVEDIPEPEVIPGYVKIKIKCCGICGSDLGEYMAGPLLIMNEPHPLTGIKAPPVVMGHEFVGDVVEIGPKVTNVQVGDRVAVDAFISCGSCRYCRQGDYRLCSQVGFNGFHGITGGFAEYTIAPEYQLYKLPPALSYEAGALAEPLSVGVHGVMQAGQLLGKRVGIFGAGPIGLSTLQVAKAAGASLLVVSEKSKMRRDMALRCGADEVIDPTEKSAADLIMGITDGLGLDIAFECAGVEPALNDAIESTRKGACIVVLAVYKKPVLLDMNALFLAEKRLVFSIGYKYDFEASLNLMNSGRVDGEGMVTKKIGLNEIVSEGFEELIKNLDNQVKILVYP